MPATTATRRTFPDGSWTRNSPASSASTPSTTVPNVVARRRSTQPRKRSRDDRRGVPHPDRRGRDRDEPVSRDPQPDRAQVRGAARERAADRVGEVGAVDLALRPPAEQLEREHDHRAVDDEHPAEAAHAPPPVAGEHERARRGRERTEDRDPRDRRDRPVELPDAEVPEAVGDVREAVPETTLLLTR